MVRRLAAAFMLLACLLGAVQPVFACVSHSDCCPSRCTDQVSLGSIWVESSACCAVQAPVGTSLSIASHSRQAPNVAVGSPALVTLADDPLRLVPALEIRAAQAATTSRPDLSLTYLRTARLRL